MQNRETKVVFEECAPTTLLSSSFILVCFTYGVYELAHEMAFTVLPLILNKLSASGTEIGLMTSLNVIAGLLLRPTIGRLSDKYSKRIICICGMTAVVLCYLGITWAAAISSVILLLVFRTLHGIGAAASSTACYAIVADVSPKSKMTDAYGYFGIFFGILGGIAPGVAIALTKEDKYVGTLLLMSGIVVIAIVAVFLIPYEKQPWYRNRKISEYNRSSKNEKGISQYIEKTAIPATVIIFLVFVSLSSAKSFLVLYAQSRGFSNIGLYFVITAVGGVIVRFFIGTIRKKTNDRTLLIIGIGMLVLNFAIISMMNNYILLIASGILNGFGTGIYNSVLNSIAIQKTTPDKYGVASSTTLLGIDLGFIVGSAVWGIIADMLGYEIVFVLATIFLIISAVVSMFIIDK